MSAPSIYICEVCNGLFGEGAIAGRKCSCSRAIPTFHGPHFGKTSAEYKSDLTTLRARLAEVEAEAFSQTSRVTGAVVAIENLKKSLATAERDRDEARAEMIRAIARCNTANAEAAQLRTDLAELRQECRRSEAAKKAAWQDSERLDWLEQSEESCLCWNVDGSKNNGWTVGDISEDTETNGATLRAAIDAARAKGGAS